MALETIKQVGCRTELIIYALLVFNSLMKPSRLTRCQNVTKIKHKQKGV